VSLHSLADDDDEVAPPQRKPLEAVIELRVLMIAVESELLGHCAVDIRDLDQAWQVHQYGDPTVGHSQDAVEIDSPASQHKYGSDDLDDNASDSAAAYSKNEGLGLWMIKPSCRHPGLCSLDVYAPAIGNETVDELDTLDVAVAEAVDVGVWRKEHDASHPQQHWETFPRHFENRQDSTEAKKRPGPAKETGFRGIQGFFGPRPEGMHRKIAVHPLRHPENKLVEIGNQAVCGRA
jgi:hypothetical protein